MGGRARGGGIKRPHFLIYLLTQEINIHTLCWVLLLVQDPGSHDGGDVANGITQHVQ